jgi:hypothetical protein
MALGAAPLQRRGLLLAGVAAVLLPAQRARAVAVAANPEPLGDGARARITRCVPLPRPALCQRVSRPIAVGQATHCFIAAAAERSTLALRGV